MIFVNCLTLNDYKQKYEHIIFQNTTLIYNIYYIKKKYLVTFFHKSVCNISKYY